MADSNFMQCYRFAKLSIMICYSMADSPYLQCYRMASLTIHHGTQLEARGRRRASCLYLWDPNALLPLELSVMAAWGFGSPTRPTSSGTRYAKPGARMVTALGSTSETSMRYGSLGPKARPRARLPLTDQMSVMTPSVRYRQDWPSSLPVLGRERTSGSQAGKLSELLRWVSLPLV